MGPFLVLAATFLLAWVLFILPQQRRIKAHQALVARLEVGDEVMTASGFFGRITALEGDEARIELAPGTVVRIARGAVARRIGDEPEPPPPVERPSGTAADRAVDRPGPGER